MELQSIDVSNKNLGSNKGGESKRPSVVTNFKDGSPGLKNKEGQVIMQHKIDLKGV